MATMPSYVCVGFDGYSESFDPSVERTDMERGLPKQRLMNTQVLAKVNATLNFFSAADAAAFEQWYFDDVHRIEFFDMTHPRTGAAIRARFENGDIGELVPLAPQFAASSRAVVLEYLR